MVLARGGLGWSNKSRRHGPLGFPFIVWHTFHSDWEVTNHTSVNQGRNSAFKPLPEKRVEGYKEGMTSSWFNNKGLLITHEQMALTKLLRDKKTSSLLVILWGKPVSSSAHFGSLRNGLEKWHLFWQDLKIWSHWWLFLLPSSYFSSLAFLVLLSWTISMYDWVLKYQFQDKSNGKKRPGQGQKLGKV